MKSQLFAASLGYLALVACGDKTSTSELAHSPVPQHACTNDAHTKHDAALVQVQKAYDADAAACYELLDAHLYLPVSLCLKAAESARKEALAKAELALELDLAACEEVPAL